MTGIAGTAMTGGAGADTFAFPNQMGHDVVTNFGLAKDTLQFSATLLANFSTVLRRARRVRQLAQARGGTSNERNLQNTLQNIPARLRQESEKNE